MMQLALLLLPLLLLWTVPTVLFVRRGRGPSSRRKRLVLSVASLLLPVVLFALWEPGPSTERRFDQGRNGLWIGSRWYTGRDERSGQAVPAEAVDALLETLKQGGVRYAYVRAGRIGRSGAIEALPDPLFFQLRDRAPDVRFLPWLSAESHDLPMTDAAWRDRLMQSLWRLHAQGVTGIHLDIEPIRDGHPGYVDLLQEIRRRFDGAFFVSQASRRIAPFGSGAGLLGERFWSEAYYRETMSASDQTVLMGYNTLLGSPKLYRVYMRHQTNLLLDWASEQPRHQVLIGIPSYEGLSDLSDPAVENIPNAVAGVRAALERHPHLPACFEGVSIYAHWLTDAAEWQQFQEQWRRPPPP